ncbi:alpha/beta hydrolase [Occultella glacieicola]|uniref:Alpha/beta hydrolase n=1 Tax=Occultella glacieicola TaxID=2518684 RepID=A0ABY2E331_9MICO|nr:alpha/beta hydrolase [Occultella glacieicola]TDE91609.1 alpha/beta hydrolase [Occultella glacieicola]
MATLSQVRSWQPEALGLLADTMVQRRRTLVALQDEIDDGAPPPTWAADSAVAAAASHTALREDLADLVAEVAQVAAALDTAADALTRAHGELDEAASVAGANGFTVSATGRVTDARDALTDAQEIADRRAVRDEIVDRIEQALRNADHADASLAAALRSAARGVDGGTATLAQAAATGTTGGQREVLPPPPGGSDHDQNSWWEGLTEAEQAEVIGEHPEWIGNVDGIPAWARDEANRALIGDYRSDLTDRLAAAREAGDDGLARTLTEKLDGLDAVEDTLELGNRHLLLLDITGTDQLMAAIAYGDVDTADHVAVFTPGFTTTVAGSMAGYDNQMADLVEQSAAQAEKYGDGGTVAAVAWLGYEAPQWDNVLDPGSSVATRGPAEAGAGNLAAFYNGLDAARDSDPHLTALGHSYGSLTTGLALQEQTGVDDAILYGSPGIGTSHVEDLDVPDGHVYRLEARRDAVADVGALGPFGIDPSHLDGITGLSTEAGSVGGNSYGESVGHNDYLTEGSMSQHNMASIIAGAPEQTVEGDTRGFGDILSWPLPWTY